MQLQIIVYDGVDELDAIGPYEVFASAQLRGADIAVSYVSPKESEHVQLHYGTTIETTGPFDPQHADVIVVPGGGWLVRSPAGAWAEIEDGTLPTLLASLPRPGLTLAGVCTGVMILAAAGITRGRPCVTHRSALAALTESGGTVIEARVVDDGDLVTCGGVTSGIDLALCLVAREFGTDMADQIAHGLEYERRGTIWKRD